MKAVLAKGWELGGEGMTALAEAVVNEIENGNNQFKPLYDWSSSVSHKIETIAEKSMEPME